MQIMETPASRAQDIMDKDATLLEELKPDGMPILHLYSWSKPAATCGYFIQPEKLLSQDACHGQILDLGRRPTGGGVVFHVTDYAFSCLVPSGHKLYSINTLDNYALINQLVVQTVEEVCNLSSKPSLLPHEPNAVSPNCQHFCMAKATKYDVMIGRQKVGGAAQRRKKQGFLHQGTISIAKPDFNWLSKVLKTEEAVKEAMQENTFIMTSSQTLEEIEFYREKIKKALIKAFTSRFSR